MAFLLLISCTGNQPKLNNRRNQDAADSRKGAEKASGELQTVSSASQPDSYPVKVLTSASGQAISVEIDTLFVFSDNISVKEARAQTLQAVRKLALEKALPVEINLSSMTATLEVETNASYDQSVATGIFMMSSSAGRFISEKVLSASPVFDERSNTLKYKMRYQAEIIPLERAYNPSLKLDIKLSETLLQDGGQFSLSLVPNANGYLYLFDFFADGSAALVFPNLDISDNTLEAGLKWEQTLRAVCDPERDYSIETLYFIFSTEPISGWEDFHSNRSANDLVFSAGEESFMLFQKWLSKSDPAQRVEKMAQIHIFKK